MPNRLECPQVPGENNSNDPNRQKMDQAESIENKKEANGTNHQVSNQKE
jgi:hypothetical protein